MVTLSDEAWALGARLGMTAAQARAIAPGLVIRPEEASACEGARAALCDVAFGFGEEVEATGDAALFEVGDLLRLYRDEASLAAHEFPGGAVWRG